MVLLICCPTGSLPSLAIGLISFDLLLHFCDQLLQLIAFCHQKGIERSDYVLVLISNRYLNLSYFYSNTTMRLGKFSILATGYLACYEYIGSKYSGTRISHVLSPYTPTCGTDLLTDGCSDGVQGMPSVVAAIPSCPSFFAGKLFYHF